MAVMNKREIEHPLLFLIVVIWLAFTVSALITELLSFDIWAGFLGVYAVLFFVLIVLGYLFVGIIKYFAS